VRLTHVLVDPHAFRRARERWQAASALDDEALRALFRASLQEAENRKTAVRIPGGLYVPFTLADEDGFLVVRGSFLKTAMPARFCPDVVAFIEERKQHGSL